MPQVAFERQEPVYCIIEMAPPERNGSLCGDLGHALS